MKVILISTDPSRSSLVDALGSLVITDKQSWLSSTPNSNTAEIFLLTYQDVDAELPELLGADYARILFLHTQGTASESNLQLQEKLAKTYNIIGLPSDDPTTVRTAIDGLLKLQSPIWAIQDFIISSYLNINKSAWDASRYEFDDLKFYLTNDSVSTNTPQFVFRAFPKERKVECSVPALEYVWCASYAFWLFYKRWTNQTSDAEWLIAMELLNWADGSIRKKVSQTWPSHLPKPIRESIDGSDDHAVTQFSLAASAWILHHELGHIRKNHIGPPSERRSEEEEADKVATEFVFRKATTEQTTFRAVGITMASLILLSLELANGYYERKSYPPSYERLWSALKDLAEDDPAIGVAISGIMLLLTRNGIPQQNLDENASLKDTLGSQIVYLSRLH
jgi:hypothetical protein